MTLQPDLDLIAAAQRAGVHYQTAYRWVRHGGLPSKMVDSKYVIAAADLDSFLAGRNAPTNPTAPSAKRLASGALAMRAALTSGDEPTARKLAQRVVSEGTSVRDLIQTVVAPTLRQLGQDWHDGLISVWVEHRASAITERILGDLAPNPRGRRRGTAVVAAVEGDRHSLPTSMAAVTLREAHWHVHHLGADMPVDDLVEFCSLHDVDVAVLTLSVPDLRPVAERAAQRISAVGLNAIIGGPGRTLDELLEEIGTAMTQRRNTDRATA